MPFEHRSRPRRAALPALAAAVLVLAHAGAHAATDKLLLTGGVTSIDGTAGGGLTPWAVIGSNATEGQVGATATASVVSTRNYSMRVAGLALAYDDRYEVSIAHQDFTTGATGRALGLPGLHLKLDVLGAKVRLAGDAVLESDRWMPQVALGVEVKRADADTLKPVLDALGAGTRGVDWYVSATKLFLAQGILVNATLRATKANQNGLLGFGGTAQERYRLEPEVSAAWLANRTLAFGAEYRRKPDNLDPSLLGAGLKEDDWFDVFAAWAPTKHVSLTVAYVQLGRIVPAIATKKQDGGYASAQIAF
ncbi:MAG: DUF3034 family protein [Caulobacter sp.]|nr:DUF3034 family protein [Vitreoscilla sp.]